MGKLVTRFGKQSGLSFDLEWETSEPKGTAAEATQGRLVARVRERVVWGHASVGESEGFDWTWIELLEHIASVWPYLEWEEADPLGLEDSPEFLRLNAEQRWRQSPASRRDEEEEQLWAFEHSHNLAAGIQGAWPPPLWLLRQGNAFLVCGEGERVRQPRSEVLETLEDFATAVLDRLKSSKDQRQFMVRKAWENRRSVRPSHFIEVATGLAPDHLLKVADGRSIDDTWEIGNQLEPNELLAAARMIGNSLTPNETRAVINQIRRVAKRSTVVLDAIAHEAADVTLSGPPWDQGYALAKWLRSRLELIKNTDRSDPETILRDWGVKVQQANAGSGMIDAISCWGPRHGPAILINPAGPHAQEEAGRRATLAHEICHLLIDRTDALPLAEVLGGRTPRDAEARARAFAAELLLPRDTAGSALAQSSDPAQTVKYLRRRYGVSREVVAWQARNSNIPMPEKVRAYLRSLVREPQSF
ncbi:MAG: ImmA/IrrE family metallo-endopeptidase [Planctomycetes bacterium]|nr:ImmA/IrrE family metallo-endopeptidase [Planctomycetota bacterium]MBI3844794.1 ImmA/IrrE family metallo-endopeptidase [Planctomycetota bacterium]